MSNKAHWRTMDSLGCPRSIMVRRWRRLIARTSGTKIPFHLQLPDLLVELGGEGLLVLLLTPAAVLKELGCTLHQDLLPGMDLAGVDFKPAGQLGDGVVALECRQGYLGLEGRAVLLPDLLHGPAPSFASF